MDIRHLKREHDSDQESNWLPQSRKSSLARYISTDTSYLPKHPPSFRLPSFSDLQAPRLDLPIPSPSSSESTTYRITSTSSSASTRSSTPPLIYHHSPPPLTTTNPLPPRLPVLPSPSDLVRPLGSRQSSLQYPAFLDPWSYQPQSRSISPSSPASYSSHSTPSLPNSLYQFPSMSTPRRSGRQAKRSEADAEDDETASQMAAVDSMSSGGGGEVMARPGPVIEGSGGSPATRSSKRTVTAGKEKEREGGREKGTPVKRRKMSSGKGKGVAVDVGGEEVVEGRERGEEEAEDSASRPEGSNGRERRGSETEQRPGSSHRPQQQEPSSQPPHPTQSSQPHQIPSVLLPPTFAAPYPPLGSSMYYQQDRRLSGQGMQMHQGYSQSGYWGSDRRSSAVPHSIPAAGLDYGRAATAGYGHPGYGTWQAAPPPPRSSSQQQQTRYSPPREVSHNTSVSVRASAPGPDRDASEEPGSSSVAGPSRPTAVGGSERERENGTPGSESTDGEEDGDGQGEAGMSVSDGGMGSTPYARTPALKVSHKMAERKRRKEMKELFDDLKAQLPPDRGMKSSKWEILTKAVDFVQHIKRQNVDMAREIEALRREVNEARGNGAYNHNNHMPPQAYGPPYAMNPAYGPGPMPGPGHGHHYGMHQAGNPGLGPMGPR